MGAIHFVGSDEYYRTFRRIYVTFRRMPIQYVSSDQVFCFSDHQDQEELPTFVAEEIFKKVPDTENEGLIKFLDYVVMTYVTPTAKFLPKIWASNEIAANRTTNAAESFHRHFSDGFYSSHPNIFDFFERLIDEQTKTYSKIRAASVSYAPMLKSSRQKLNYLLDLRTRLDNNQIDQAEYVRRVAFKNLPVNM